MITAVSPDPTTVPSIKYTLNKCVRQWAIEQMDLPKEEAFVHLKEGN